jgi:DHA2 family methylenomycin A resistance protein-like MFS transporter
VITGCVIGALGVLPLLALQAHAGLAWLLVALAALGCGAGLVTASVVSAVVQATPSDRSGLATGMSNTARQAGTATGVATFGAVAGSAGHATDFVAAVHVLTGIAAGLWCLAAVVAAATIAGRARE